MAGYEYSVDSSVPSVSAIAYSVGKLFICLWFPPLAVLMHEERCSPDVFLNVALTLLGLVVSRCCKL